jgi:hypothetical protein
MLGGTFGVFTASLHGFSTRTESYKIIALQGRVFIPYHHAITLINASLSQSILDSCP